MIMQGKFSIDEGELIYGCMEEFRRPRRILTYLEDSAEELLGHIDLVITGQDGREYSKRLSLCLEM